MTSAPAPAPAPGPSADRPAPRRDGPRPPAGGRGFRGGQSRGSRGGRGRGGSGGRRPMHGPSSQSTSPAKRADYYPDAPDAKTVRVIPLGGVEEVGRNMCVIEANGDIFVLDVGFQFMSESDAPGIDYVLPNTKYLEKN